MSVPQVNGLQNARDVGGLHTRDGRRVRSGVLFRSDAPYAGDGAPGLEPWPPEFVVDLRSPDEYGDEPHPLAGASTTVIKRSLLAAASPAAMVAAAEEGELSLRSVYAGLLDTGGTAVAEIADIVAGADGPVLVHCTAGKDRTGITVAAILAAVGVERDEIVADFVTTAENTDAIVARMAAAWPEDIREERLEQVTVRNGHLMLAPGEEIEAVLDVLEAWPGGGVRAWLVEHGLSEAALERLRARLVD